MLTSYSDADWAGDPNDRRSTSGLLILVNEIPVSWKSKKQSIVALSSCEAEYIALSETTKQVIWIRNLLQELTLLREGPTTLYEGNTSAIKWARSERLPKHVDLRHHYVADQAQAGKINLQYCPTKSMLADIFTKAINAGETEFIRTRLHVKNVAEEEC